MRRSKFVLAVIFLWLFSVTAPPALILLNGVEDTYVTFVVNDEEPQEQKKKDNLEEKLFSQKLFDFSLDQIFLVQSGSVFFTTCFSAPNLEIHLPPPKALI